MPLRGTSSAPAWPSVAGVSERRAYAAALKHHRGKRGWTQQQLADAVGVDVRQVKRYEAGEALPNLAQAVNIAVELRASLDNMAGIEVAGESDPVIYVNGIRWFPSDDAEGAAPDEATAQERVATGHEQVAEADALLEQSAEAARRGQPDSRPEPRPARRGRRSS